MQNERGRDMAELTDRQRAFAEEYIKDLNATRAYKAVYKAVKKDETAAQAGSRLLNNVNVKKYINENIKQIKSDRIAEATEVMEFLTRGMRQELEEEVVNFDMSGKVVRTTKKNSIKEATKCAELLGKRYTLFTDKIKMETTVQIQESWFVEEDGEI